MQKISASQIDLFPKPKKDLKGDNPANILFGHRFHKNQTEIEFLIEFLLLFISDKKIGEKIELKGFGSDDWKGFPSKQDFDQWSIEEPLKYNPPLHIILKLFAFMGSSSIEARHTCHIDKFNEIIKDRMNSIEHPPSLNSEQVLNLIEQVLAGFVGIAGNRVWCTHSFIPISPGIIAGEMIWEKAIARRNPNLSWDEAIEKTMFAYSKHDFFARGGELLYLQLCNFFRMTESDEVKRFEEQMGHPAGTASKLRDRIEEGIKRILTTTPGPELDKIASWIEKADLESDYNLTKRRKMAECNWCPEESWPEAYLFAYELSNILDSLLDSIEKIEMLKISCVLQIMRSLSAQSARYWNGLTEDIRELGGKNGFAWIITDPNTTDQPIKESSRRNLVKVQEMIHGAIRRLPMQTRNVVRKTYKKADEQGPGLFLSLGKRIEFIAPYKGPGARFVLNETLLRYFVLALIPPGERRRMTTFQEALYQHYGAAIVGSQLKRAVHWTYPGQNIQLSSAKGDWFENQLRATGFLIPLSDAVSLIRNPFAANSQSE